MERKTAGIPIWKALPAAGATAVLLVYLLHSVDLVAVWQQMKGADPALLLAALGISAVENMIAGGDKWRQWFKENPDRAPVKANRWIPLMNRQQILDSAELLDNASPMTS